MSNLFVVGSVAGTNSLYPSGNAAPQAVMRMRFDDIVESAHIDHVLMVKSDTEGHDFMVMKGATQTLSRGGVDVWQFEYNHRWVQAGATLHQVFEFISDKPYRLGRLHSRGIETYEAWHPELEKYFETNYVLVRRLSALEALCTPAVFDESNVACRM